MRRPARTSPSRQRGVAIITAMLVVALGTITMVAITSRQQLDLQRERNEGVIQMARDLSASGERFAAALLYRDRKEALRENTDSLDDDWAQTIPPVPIDQAAIQGCIIDMQGRFNLNNLIDAGGRAQPIYVEQLQRLLRVLNVEAVKAQAIVDWLDADLDVQIPDGAEDDYYTSLDPPYRAANRSFASVSELQLVKGFDPQVEQERGGLRAPRPARRRAPEHRRADGGQRQHGDPRGARLGQRGLPDRHRALALGDERLRGLPRVRGHLRSGCRGDRHAGRAGRAHAVFVGRGVRGRGRGGASCRSPRTRTIPRHPRLGRSIRRQASPSMRRPRRRSLFRSSPTGTKSA